MRMGSLSLVGMTIKDTPLISKKKAGFPVFEKPA